MVAWLPGKNAQEAQVGGGFDAFLFPRFASLDRLLLLLGWVAVGWWRPALDGSGCALVVVGGFGAAAAHRCVWVFGWLVVGLDEGFVLMLVVLLDGWFGVDLRIAVREFLMDRKAEGVSVVGRIEE